MNTLIGFKIDMRLSFNFLLKGIKQKPSIKNWICSLFSASGDYSLIDPFVDMDQEELQKLELALKSEKGRQILGENVAAMLGKLPHPFYV